VYLLIFVSKSSQAFLNGVASIKVPEMNPLCLIIVH